MRFNLVGRAEREGFDEVWDALIDEHGPDAVLAALAPHKGDPLVAAVLTHTCEIFRVRLRDYFTAAEIVSASETSLLAPVWWKSGIREGRSGRRSTATSTGRSTTSRTRSTFSSWLRCSTGSRSTTTTRCS